MSARHILKPTLVHCLHVTFYRFGTTGHRSVDPDAEFHRRTTRDIAPEIGRDLNRHRDIARTHPTIKLVITSERRLFDKVTGTGEVECPRLATDGLVAVEHRKAQVFHIHTDAVTHYQHQDHRSHQRQRRTYWIASQFQRFAAAVAKQTAQAKSLTRRVGGVVYHGRRFGFVALPCRFLQIGDKCLFQTGGSAFLNQFLRCTAGKHFSGVHQ
ncbi:Uncharacterised protein [Shigella sonnei]|nr:Uncharacterised protein [Shigella sonnei]CSP80332.1 Uncharacterised protein [Shigella sonnei]